MNALRTPSYRRLRRSLPALFALAVMITVLAGCGSAGRAPSVADMAAGAAERQAAVDLAPPMAPRELPGEPPPMVAAVAPVAQPEPAQAVPMAAMERRDAREELAEAAPMPMGAADDMVGGIMAAEAMGGDDGLRWAWELEEGGWEDEWDGGGGWGGGGGWDEPVPVVQYAPVRAFPVPDYSQSHDGPRVDFRDTIFWNPSVRTGVDGKAQVRFYASDAVSSFRASVEGLALDGQIARGEAVFASKLPVSLAVKLPLEVTRGDVVELPVTVANDTERAQEASLEVELGEAFALDGAALPASLALAPGERKSFFVTARVVGDGKKESDGQVRIATRAGSFSDEVERTVRVVPEGFPFEAAVAGALHTETIVHEVAVTRPLEGTLEGTLRLYPSPTSTVMSGLDSMLRQPGGCFEQTSSSNYPNVMVLDYLQTHGELDPAVVERSQSMLDGGYQILTGYESPSHGFEWWGADPAHEALTAYGVMQFTQMSKVYDVDPKLIERTVSWLLGRRNGEGGYHKNPNALHTWANAEVTDAYITYALTEVGHTDLAKELEFTRKLASKSDDAYILALAANTLLNVEPESKAAQSAVSRLVALQDPKDGAWRKAAHSVVMSSGINLEIETTALAARALMKAGGERKALDQAIDFLRANNNGWGGYGTTQATVLALQALTEHAAHSAALPGGTRITVKVNGKPVHELSIDEDIQGEMVLGGLGEHLHEGVNRIELTLAAPSTLPEGLSAADIELPYSVLVGWRTEKPSTSPKAAIHVDAELASERVALGESVRMSVALSNQEDREQPMLLARVGIPGGLTAQTWQLKELREKGLVDFYETREREVILYYRKMAPRDTRRVELDLVASVPGTFEAPASSAYLYYTDEHKHWEAPERITITR